MLLLGIFILNLLVSHEDFQNEAVPSEQPISHLKSGHYSWTEKDIINDFNVLFWFASFCAQNNPDDFDFDPYIHVLRAFGLAALFSQFQ